MLPSGMLPKIELHVHLEGTIRARTLLAIARRNGLPLPADTVEGLARLYEFRDFGHFLEVWALTTNCLRTAQDFRQVIVDYAAEAAAHAAVYIEGIFSPAERIKTGVSWDALFNGYCDGPQQAEEDYGVIVRLTPDLYWGLDPEEATEAARKAAAYSDRGVVALGIGGAEGMYSPEKYAKAFAIARDGGLGSVLHAGQGAGPELFGTDLSQEYSLLPGMGVDPRQIFHAASRGALRDEATRSKIITIGEQAAWPGL